MDILTNGLEGGGFLKGDRNGRGSVFQNAGLESFKRKKKGGERMKKITVVAGTILAMLVIMVFPCYGEGIPACYQKNNGQLRILTDQKCDQGHKGDPKPGHDCDHDCDYTNRCRPSEIPITLLGVGGELPEVPIICAGYVDCYNSPGTCQFISSCISSVEYLELGQYKITFTTGFNKPICVFYMYPIVGNLIFTEYTPGTPTEILVKVSWLEGYIDIPFNFICAEH